jgi:hypothetical protein
LTKKLGLYILNCASSAAKLSTDLVDLLIFSYCYFVEEAGVDSQSLSLLLDITLFGWRWLCIFYTLLASLIYYI